jgi:hypothetical protein
MQRLKKVSNISVHQSMRCRNTAGAILLAALAMIVTVEVRPVRAESANFEPATAQRLSVAGLRQEVQQHLQRQTDSLAEHQRAAERASAIQRLLALNHPSRR